MAVVEGGDGEIVTVDNNGTGVGGHVAATEAVAAAGAATGDTKSSSSSQAGITCDETRKKETSSSVNDVAMVNKCLSETAADVHHQQQEEDGRSKIPDAAAAVAMATPPPPQQQQQQLALIPHIQTEEDRLWSIVTANPADFTSWTLSIQEAERLDDIAKIRRVYDAFLAEFPLCYGYWKKYADHEARHDGSQEKIVEVYERAVKGVTYSVDIWMHYCTFVAEKSEDMGEIRRLFERGLAYVGTDYLAHILWDKYLEFEYSQEEWGRVAQLYTRILQIPLQQLDRYYQSFKQYVHAQLQDRPLSELLTSEEVRENAELEASSGLEVEVDVAMAAVKGEGGEDGVSSAGRGGDGGGEKEAIQGEKGGSSTIKAGRREHEQLEKYMASREKIFRATKEQDMKMRDFEMAIRRPYFHVKPLDEMQLNNWNRYLDFVEKEGKLEKTTKLFERCLIACAHYAEYWIRYIERLEADADWERTEEALKRATSIFVKRRPEIHMFAARLYEKRADVEAARAEYKAVVGVGGASTILLEGVIKHANFERRQRNFEKAMEVYEAAIEQEKCSSKGNFDLFVHLSLRYARFLDQGLKKKTDKAREVLKAAAEKAPDSKILWQAFIFFETLHIDDDGDGDDKLRRVRALVEQAIVPTRADGSPSGLSTPDREEISLQFLEFADLHGDVDTVHKAEVAHKRMFSRNTRKAPSESKKRALSADHSVLSDRSSKMLKSSSNAIMPAVNAGGGGQIAYANGQQQGQWGGGGAYVSGGGGAYVSGGGGGGAYLSGGGAHQQSYGSQQQGWQQQASQPPSAAASSHGEQQWSGGYGAAQAQQASYNSGYSAYGSGYGAQQQQQQQGYGGCGQTYPLQPQSTHRQSSSGQQQEGYVQASQTNRLQQQQLPAQQQQQQGGGGYYEGYYQQ